MGQPDVERTLGRLITDQGFREAFFLDPRCTCITLGLQLVAHELEALLHAPRPALASLGRQLDDRICRLDVEGGRYPACQAGQASGRETLADGITRRD